MWAKYHRRQARTLVNLARLTRDPNTAASWKRLAIRHAEMADRAEEVKGRASASSTVRWCWPAASASGGTAQSSIRPRQNALSTGW
jgi:hypothetical protein